MTACSNQVESKKGKPELSSIPGHSRKPNWHENGGKVGCSGDLQAALVCTQDALGTLGLYPTNDRTTPYTDCVGNGVLMLPPSPALLRQLETSSFVYDII